jgi:hypothetical protein
VGELTCRNRSVICGEGVAVECLNDLGYSGGSGFILIHTCLTPTARWDEIVSGITATAAVNTAPTASDMSGDHV